MKSGIRSTGERAYPTVIPAKIFANMGVSLSFKLKKQSEYLASTFLLVLSMSS